MASRSRVFQWAAAATFVVVVAIQFVPVHRTNPPVQHDVSAPTAVNSILRRACYDCHSNETEWPWYSHVAPVSWFVVGHVNEGRGDLNFSEWPAFDPELQSEAFHDIEEQVSKHKMPLRSYQLLHAGARLGDGDRETLLGWARSGI